MPSLRNITPSGSIDRLRNASTSGERREVAIDLVERARNLEVVRAALMVLAGERDPALRAVLHAKYEWCESVPTKRDSSGFIRADIVRTLHPIV